jgi:hypothetical protein
MKTSSRKSLAPRLGCVSIPLQRAAHDGTAPLFWLAEPGDHTRK